MHFMGVVMSDFEIESICKNGLMRSIFLMSDSHETFKKLLDLTPRARFKLMAGAAGKISASAVFAAEKALAKKSAAQLPLFS